MKGFSAEWLALREVSDTAARSASITDAAVKACSGKDTLTIVDLGAGSGANLRYLAPRLARPQTWRLIDRDADLMRRAEPPDDAADRIEVERKVCDLNEISSDLDFAQAGLVTASALMDLVSAEWFAALAERCRQASVPLLFALSYDGRIDFTPSDPEDNLVRARFNEHQAGDKGFGPALGPQASTVMRSALERLGYEVALAASDWQLGSGEALLQQALLEGYATAALEIDSDSSGRIGAWLSRRTAFIGEGKARMRVGHQDLFASL